MAKIITDTVKIPKKENFDNNYIEDCLAKSGYDIIRWAIISVDEQNFIVTVSHQI